MGRFYHDIPLPPLHEANYAFDDEPLELAIIDSFKYTYTSWLLVDNEMKNIDVQ